MKNPVFTKTFWASISVLILTIIHHFYGALIYEAPFRMHVTFIVIPIIALLILAHQIYRKHPASQSGKISFWSLIIITATFSIGLIGLYEGGYNHLLKNLLFFGDASQVTLDKLFPPPTYELPNDFWFEATGILQFLLGIYTAYFLIKMLRKNK